MASMAEPLLGAHVQKYMHRIRHVLASCSHPFAELAMDVVRLKGTTTHHEAHMQVSQRMRLLPHHLHAPLLQLRLGGSQFADALPTTLRLLIQLHSLQSGPYLWCLCGDGRFAYAVVAALPK